ncbi:hypothetical protein TNCV_1875851 [Trichonephila clavipes]|nr:hypothetical protein TNCV_1875851 [Trichonephila clavipes]
MPQFNIVGIGSTDFSSTEEKSSAEKASSVLRYWQHERRHQPKDTRKISLKTGWLDGMSWNQQTLSYWPAYHSERELDGSKDIRPRTAHLPENWLKPQTKQNMERPTGSLRLNPIKHVWETL